MFHEGSYGKDSLDIGGETRYGITYEYAYLGLCKKVLHKKPSYDHFNQISKKEVQQFIRYHWDIVSASEFYDKRMAFMFSEYAWSGPGWVQDIQRTLNENFTIQLKVDTRLDKDEVSRLNNIGGDTLFYFLKNYREKRFKKQKVFYRFGRGWMKRLNQIEKL